jgi:hypothetical protein
MLSLMLYERSEVSSSVSKAFVSVNFEDVVKVSLATDNLFTLEMEAARQLPDIIMIDLDYNDIEDNILNVVISVVKHYEKQPPMVIMTHSGDAELFTGNYPVLEDMIGSNICLIAKPMEYKKLSKCIMKRLIDEKKNSDA